jgi:phosphoribosylformylglycinamidine synthase subunit PurQ / glutaminase
MSNPDVLVLKTDGINCDEEMAHAFKVAGGNPELVHINQLREGSRRMRDFGALAIPGGFSYGDDIASGKVLANELNSFLSDELQSFIADGKPVIGICNGDQVLVRTGLLPFRTLGEQPATLAQNESGRFECRWINLSIGASACKFVQPDDFPEQPVPMQTAHGEGRFLTDSVTRWKLNKNGQIVFRYTDWKAAPTAEYPHNPSGSTDGIAGICDPSGLVLGMMPHPERSIESFHPHREKTALAREAARVIFTKVLTYARA